LAALWFKAGVANEEALRATALTRAPSFVVPTDNKRFTRPVVAAAIVEAVEPPDLRKIDAEKKKELVTMRAALARET
jgi:polyphosphate kinase 2 (PPK2 family)